MANDLDSPRAIAFGAGNSKVCALFFDRIVMLIATDEAKIEIETRTGQVFNEGDLTAFINVELNLNRLNEKGSFPEMNFGDAGDLTKEITSDLERITSEIIQSEALATQGKIELAEVPFTEFIRTPLFRNLWISKIQKMLTNKGALSVPFFDDSDPFLQFLHQGQSEALEIKLSNIGVIDHSRLDWGQVMEIRKDADSISKLRRLRLFMTEKYNERTADYIRDDLLLRVYDYEQACKKHGLELVISSISKTLDSKSILGTLAASAASTLATDLTGGILSGIAIQIGQLAINVAEKRLAFESNKNNSEIAYLMDIKRRINEASKK
jgi:hypothetical protein